VHFSSPLQEIATSCSWHLNDLNLKKILNRTILSS
jgi:hypothetical protein